MKPPRRFARTLLAATLSAVLAACHPQPLPGLTTFAYPGGVHVDTHVHYAETPPAGGPHNPRWQRCGVYTRPLQNEYAVHSMEHGAVWVTYRPGLADADLARLKAAVKGRQYTLLSPYPGLTHQLTLSAWNAQLPLDDARDPRVQAFLSRYEQGADAPERGAPCDGPYAVTTTR